MLKSLIVCGQTLDHPCGWNDLVQLARNFMTDMMVLSTYFAIITFIIIGFLFLTSQGSTTARDKAKSKLRALIYGYVFILGAWLIVYTISHVLLSNPDAYSLIK